MITVFAGRIRRRNFWTARGYLHRIETARCPVHVDAETSKDELSVRRELLESISPLLDRIRNAVQAETDLVVDAK